MGETPARLIAKATEWLEVGGFFNPEMMARGDAQNLVIELRNALKQLVSSSCVPAETPMQRLKGSLRGEETDAQFDQAVREIREAPPAVTEASRRVAELALRLDFDQCAELLSAINALREADAAARSVPLVASSSTETELRTQFVDTFTELARRQQVLDPAAMKVLYDNLWLLYDDTDLNEARPAQFPSIQVKDRPQEEPGDENAL